MALGCRSPDGQRLHAGEPALRRGAAGGDGSVAVATRASATTSSTCPCVQATGLLDVVDDLPERPVRVRRRSTRSWPAGRRCGGPPAPGWSSCSPTARRTPRSGSVPRSLPIDEVTPLLPIEVGDYVDFYSSIHHATNLGRILRPDGEPLLPNWTHLPSATTAARAPWSSAASQSSGRVACARRAATAASRRTGRADALDIELEVGVVVGRRHELGTLDGARRRRPSTCSGSCSSTTGRRATSRPTSTSRSGRSSARASPRRSSRGSCTLDALAPFLVDRRRRTRRPPTTSRHRKPWGSTSTSRCARGCDAHRPISTHRTSPTCTGPFAQQLAHMTANGASVRPGDLFGSGTVSGPTPGS